MGSFEVFFFSFFFFGFEGGWIVVALETGRERGFLDSWEFMGKRNMVKSHGRIWEFWRFFVSI